MGCGVWGVACVCVCVCVCACTSGLHAAVCCRPQTERVAIIDTFARRSKVDTEVRARARRALTCAHTHHMHHVSLWGVLVQGRRLSTAFTAAPMPGAFEQVGCVCVVCVMGMCVSVCMFVWVHACLCACLSVSAAAAHDFVAIY